VKSSVARSSPRGFKEWVKVELRWKWRVIRRLRSRLGATELECSREA
jgi:hypothetical protein